MKKREYHSMRLIALIRLYFPTYSKCRNLKICIQEDIDLAEDCLKTISGKIKPSQSLFPSTVSSRLTARHLLAKAQLSFRKSDLEKVSEMAVQYIEDAIIELQEAEESIGTAMYEESTLVEDFTLFLQEYLLKLGSVVRRKSPYTNQTSNTTSDVRACTCMDNTSAENTESEHQVIISSSEGAESIDSG